MVWAEVPRKKNGGLSDRLRYFRSYCRVRWGINPDEVDINEFADMQKIDMGDGKYASFNGFIDRMPDKVEKLDPWSEGIFGGLNG